MTVLESTIEISECEHHDDCPRIATLRLVWPERFLTTNVCIRAHWRKAYEFTAQWREAFRLMAKGCPRLEWCNVTVQTIHGTDRKMDVGADALALKAAIDGVVDAGVLPDDSPQYVRKVTSLAPVFERGVEALIVTLVGPVADAAPSLFDAAPIRGVEDVETELL